MKRIVPGIHSVEEALKVRPKKITELWLREGHLNEDLEKLQAEAHRHHVKIKKVNQKTLDHQVYSHQGVIAFIDGGPDWPHSTDLKETKTGLIFALDSLEDPQNVGSLVRSAWNLGVLGILNTKERSAGDSPAAEKVGSGGFEHVPILEVSNLAAELLSLKELGFWVYGLETEGGQSLCNTELSAKSIIVIGSEESGMRKPVAQACDALISIPQKAGSESFNAAVAGAITGFEFLRQRGLSENLKDSRKKL
jgi:23S rRNA (guanosine2251-2'-O)-methyltransferase